MKFYILCNYLNAFILLLNRSVLFYYIGKIARFFEATRLAVHAETVKTSFNTLSKVFLIREAAKQLTHVMKT